MHESIMVLTHLADITGTSEISEMGQERYCSLFP